MAAAEFVSSIQGGLKVPPGTQSELGAPGLQPPGQAPHGDRFTPVGRPPTVQFNEPEAPKAFIDAELMAAAFQQEHTLISAQEAAREGRQLSGGPVDPTSDVTEHLRPEELVIQDLFADANTREDVQVIRRSLMREREARQILGDRPVGALVASAFAILGDPTTYLGAGIVGAARGGTVAGRIALGAGVTGAETAGQEAILQMTQRERTLGETAAAVLLGATLGGTFSGVAAAATRSQRADFRGAAEDFAAVVDHMFPEQVRPGEQILRGEAVGAAPRPRPNPEDTRLVSAFGLEKLVAKMGRFGLGLPSVELAASRFTSSRETVFRLVDVGGVVEGDLRGFARTPPVELKINAYANRIIPQMNQGVRTLHKDLRRQGLNMSLDEFATEIGKAMRRGDAHDIPQVAKAAQDIRAAVFDPLKEEAVARGLLPEDVDVSTAISYFTRVYDRGKIEANMPEFRARVVGWLGDEQRKAAKGFKGAQRTLTEVDEQLAIRSVDVDALVQTRGELQARLPNLKPDDRAAKRVQKELDEVQAKLKEARAEVRKLKKRRTAALKTQEDTALANLDPAELDDIAKAISDKILGDPAGRISFIKVPAARGPLKERTFNIPDELIEDFLESNVLEVGNRYIRTMSADIEFAREFGEVNPGETLAAHIGDEADAAIQAATTQAERVRLRRQMERDQLVVKGLVDKIRGVTDRPQNPTFAPLRRIGTTIRNLNFLRLLGSSTLSQIPDAGIIVMNEGLGRTSGFLLRDMGRGFKGVKLGRREGRQAAVAWNIVNSQRSRALLDLGDRYITESRFESAVDRMSQGFGNIILLNPYNDMVESLTSVLASSRILKVSEDLAAGRQVSQSDRRKLAAAFIDEDMARRIAAESGNWERMDADVIGANLEAWADREAAETFRVALMKDVRNTIFAPGRGDAPLWTSEEWGKMLFQFKRFSARAVGGVTIPALQRLNIRDVSVLNGIMVMVGFGALGTALRDIVSDGEVRERTARQWTADAIDRSGVVAAFLEMDTLMDRFTGGISAQRALSGETATRFATRGLFEQALGPSAGAIADLQMATQGALAGEFTRSDLHRMMRLAPGQNIFYLRYVLGLGVDEAAETLNLPERSSQ